MVNYNNRVFNGIKIELKDKNEEYNFYNLNLKFVGASTEDGSDYYKYSLDILYNKEEVNNDFFVDNYYIRCSDHYAGMFYVLRASNYYFLISDLGAQYNGQYVIIINSSGDFIKSYFDVHIDDINSDDLTFTVSKCNSIDNCNKNVYAFSEL